jgi:hypothetical protein
MWRCDDGLFLEVSPFRSDALLTTVHPLLENVLQTVCRKLQDESGIGRFDLFFITTKFLLKRFHHFKIAARLIALSP